jgi:hypothetical protein
LLRRLLFASPLLGTSSLSAGACEFLSLNTDVFPRQCRGDVGNEVPAVLVHRQGHPHAAGMEGVGGVPSSAGWPKILTCFGRCLARAICAACCYTVAVEPHHRPHRQDGRPTSARRPRRARRPVRVVEERGRSVDGSCPSLQSWSLRCLPDNAAVTPGHYTPTYTPKFNQTLSVGGWHRSGGGTASEARAPSGDYTAPP